MIWGVTFTSVRIRKPQANSSLFWGVISSQRWWMDRLGSIWKCLLSIRSFGFELSVLITFLGWASPIAPFSHLNSEMTTKKVAITNPEPLHRTDYYSSASSSSSIIKALNNPITQRVSLFWFWSNSICISFHEVRIFHGHRLF